MLVYLVRHGESQGNAEGVFQGTSDSFHLTEKGKKEASALKKVLPPVGMIVSSPLSRAKESAGILSGGKVPVVFHDGLKERGFGIWQGRIKEQLKKEFPREMAVYEETRSLAGVPGSEPTADFVKRASEAFFSIVSQAQGKDILMVSHGGPIRAILASLLGIPYHKVCAINISNCGVTAIHADQGRMKILCVNRTPDSWPR